MNVTTKTVKTFFVEMTEGQARDLLTMIADDNGEYAQLDIRDRSINETLDALRQALLQIGLTKRKD